MSNYKETDLAGKSWQRCYAVDIQNPFGQAPRITLQEEVITTIADRVLQHPVGCLNVPFDPSSVIVLLDTETGEPTGETMTQGQIHSALWSLYMTAATYRDSNL